MAFEGRPPSGTTFAFNAPIELPAHNDGPIEQLQRGLAKMGCQIPFWHPEQCFWHPLTFFCSNGRCQNGVPF